MNGGDFKGRFTYSVFRTIAERFDADPAQSPLSPSLVAPSFSPPGFFEAVLVNVPLEPTRVFRAWISGRAVLAFEICDGRF
jgi:hypothetical protein